MIVNDIEIPTDIELLTPQSHENVAIIPLRTPKKYVDLLTLQKGFELGLVEVKECETSTVNTLIVENHAVTPLILIDGEEVVGGDQNRLVNATTIIAANSQSPISVSCTERGRWGYKSEFKSSKYIADYNTRRAKMSAMRYSRPVQNEVWSSIDTLEADCCNVSPTSAMSESYEKENTNLEEILESFEIVEGQTGILIIVNGEIKGFELFFNHETYRAFHEKILKSYLISTKVENTTFTINEDAARIVIEDALESSFEKKETTGLEDAYEFENSDGLGKCYIYQDEIMHISYFKKADEDKSMDDMDAAGNVNMSVRD